MPPSRRLQPPDGIGDLREGAARQHVPLPGKEGERGGARRLSPEACRGLGVKVSRGTSTLPIRLHEVSEGVHRACAGPQAQGAKLASQVVRAPEAAPSASQSRESPEHACHSVRAIEVHDQELPRRPQAPRAFLQEVVAVGDVMEDVHHEDRVERAGLERKVGSRLGEDRFEPGPGRNPAERARVDVRHREPSPEGASELKRYAARPAAEIEHPRLRPQAPEAVPEEGDDVTPSVEEVVGALGDSDDAHARRILLFVATPFNCYANALMRSCILAILFAVMGCSAPAPRALERPPEDWKRAVERGDAAIETLKVGLVQRLIDEVNKNGPVGAIRVCGDEAQAIARRAAEKHGVGMGRTSHRLRNPANAPRPWAKSYVDAAPGLPANEVGARFYDLGDRVGFLRPILTGPLCLKCHGESLEPAVGEVLKRSYPNDRATGFKENELRGFFWVEVPK